MYSQYAIGFVSDNGNRNRFGVDLGRVVLKGLDQDPGNIIPVLTAMLCRKQILHIFPYSTVLAAMTSITGGLRCHIMSKFTKGHGQY